MHRNAMRRSDLGGQSGGRQVSLLRDPAGDPILKGRQLAMTAAIALGLRRETPGRLHQLDHIVDELDRDLEPRRRRPVRVPLRHMVHYPLPELYRMRLSHHRPPYLPQGQGITVETSRES